MLKGRPSSGGGCRAGASARLAGARSLSPGRSCGRSSTRSPTGSPTYSLTGTKETVETLERQTGPVDLVLYGPAPARRGAAVAGDGRRPRRRRPRPRLPAPPLGPRRRRRRRSPSAPSPCSPAPAWRSSPATRCSPPRSWRSSSPSACSAGGCSSPAIPGAGAGRSSPPSSLAMFVVWLPNQWDLDSRVDTDLTNQARIEDDLTDLVDAGAFEPLCGKIAVPNHRAVPRLAFGLDVKPTADRQRQRGRRPQARLLRRPRQPLRDPQLHPRPQRPDRLLVPAAQGLPGSREQRVLGGLSSLRDSAPPRRRSADDARRRPLPRPHAAAPAGSRSRPPPPGSGSCRGRSTPRVDAGVYEVDGFEVGAKTVARLHRQGRKVDLLPRRRLLGELPARREAAFPKAVLGRAYEGYPDERWLDVRRIDLLAPILRQRFDLCRAQGLRRGRARQRRRLRKRDRLPAHAPPTSSASTAGSPARSTARGMAVALKNDPGQVEAAASASFDFAVVEECFAYDECGEVQPLRRGGQARSSSPNTAEPLAAICAQAEHSISA